MLSIETVRGGEAEAARHYGSEKGRRPDGSCGAESELRAIWWTPGETFGVRRGAEMRPDEARRACRGTIRPALAAR